MMTSQADVMQMGVVIGQAAEHVHLYVCVRLNVKAARKYAASSGALSVSQSLGRTLGPFAFALEEEEAAKDKVGG